MFICQLPDSTCHCPHISRANSQVPSPLHFFFIKLTWAVYSRCITNTDGVADTISNRLLNPTLDRYLTYTGSPSPQKRPTFIWLSLCSSEMGQIAYISCGHYSFCFGNVLCSDETSLCNLNYFSRIRSESTETGITSEYLPKFDS